MSYHLNTVEHERSERFAIIYSLLEYATYPSRKFRNFVIQVQDQRSILKKRVIYFHQLLSCKNLVQMITNPIAFLCFTILKSVNVASQLRTRVTD